MIVDLQSFFLEPGDDGILDISSRALAKQNTDIALISEVVIRIADERYVVNRRAGSRCQVVVLAVVVGLDALIRIVAALLGNPELPFASPAVGPVEAVIGDPGANGILDLRRSPKELDAVVLVEVDCTNSTSVPLYFP